MPVALYFTKNPLRSATAADQSSLILRLQKLTVESLWS